MNNYPRILIFGPPFNNFTGGGITLSNLFKGWPKDRIAVASTGHVLNNIRTDVLLFRLRCTEVVIENKLFPLLQLY